MLKKMRHQAILDIVSRRHIPNQAVLLDELEKLNHRVTQATVSRDLTELNLVKDRHGYLNPVEPEKGEHKLRLSPINTLGFFVVGMDIVNNLVLIRAVPGSAHQVGSVLEGADFPEVIGTIASSDTVLVITRSPDEAVTTRAKMSKLLS